jgi:hypothetical protein
LLIGFNKKDTKDLLNHMIDNYRKKAIVLFDPTNNQIATRYAGFLKRNNEDQYYEPVLTTSDGNCFYNAISLQLYGHENHSKRLRLVSLYVLCQYELYFKEICTKTAGDYEQLLVRTSKDKKWATELNILAMTIILDRPIALWSHYEKRNILPFNTIVTHTLTFTTEQQYIKDHINLIFQDLHFTSLHSKILNYKLPLLPKLSNFQRYLMKALI